VTGQIDLIALVRVRRHEDIAEVVSDQLNKVPGVVDTETHIAYRAYSRHDLESAFAIGID
jgi:DNA-binding Lrp family transcriptional regulator